MRAFKTISPAGPGDVVAKITVITDDSTLTQSNTLTFFADGQPGIYFHESDADIFLNGNGKKLPNLFLYGQTVKPVNITTTGPFKAVILHLHAPAIKVLFGMDAVELTDRCIDCGELPWKEAADLKDILLDRRKTDDQVLLLSDAIRSKQKTVQSVADNEILHAVRRITHSDGTVPLSALHEELHMTERTFQRRFLRYVGISPRLFKRICKFQAACRSLESGSFEKYTDIVYDHDFTDQSHFNKVFKEFTGYTPTEYLAWFAGGEGSQKLSDATVAAEMAELLNDYSVSAPNRAH